MLSGKAFFETASSGIGILSKPHLDVGKYLRATWLRRKLTS